MKYVLKYCAVFFFFIQFSLAFGAEDIRVLFIGNSITYYNNMPEMLEAIAKANPDNPQIKTTLNAVGGRTLTRASKDESLVRQIQEGDFDFVVLQPHSKLNNRQIINGAPRIIDENSLMASIKTLTNVIAETDAQAVVFKHWFSRNVPPEDKPFFNWAFGLAAKKFNVPILDMDRLWYGFKKANPDLKLFADNVHPTPLGSLLSASGWYAFLANPKGDFNIPLKIKGTSIYKGSGTVNEGKIVELVSVGIEEISKIMSVHQALGFPILATPIKIRPPKPDFAK